MSTYKELAEQYMKKSEFPGSVYTEKWATMATMYANMAMLELAEKVTSAPDEEERFWGDAS